MTLIRPFTPQDHPATIEINNLNWPDSPTTLERRLEGDAKRDPKYVFERHVLELDGQVVAYGTINQSEWTYHPQKFVVYLQVNPAFQNQGLGRKLYDFLLGQAAPYNPNRLISTVRENRPAAVHFALKRGFAETLRSWECRLDVSGFDFGPYRGYRDKVSAQGYRLASFAELGDSEASRRGMWNLEAILVRDVPMSEEETWPSFERYSQQIFESRDFIPEAVNFAIAGNGEWVGMSELWSKRPLPELSNGLTGVKREHRRKGLALALKLRGIEYAKANGIRAITTVNESNNQAMLEINQRYGLCPPTGLGGYCQGHPMNIRSLGIQSDLMLRSFESEIVDREQYVVVHTPQNPTFRWGNFLIFPDPPKAGDLQRWKQIFEAELGHLKHYVFAWDAPNGEKGQVEAFLEAGFCLDDSVVQTAQSQDLRKPRTFNTQCQCRTLVNSDWEEWLELALAQNAAEPEGKREGEGYQIFLERKIDERKRMIKAGWGQWFGAFVEGRMASSMGLFVREGLGRFQAVDTHPAFRRQGLAGTLLYHAAQWGFSEMKAKNLVIVADQNYFAKDLYRSVGFEPKERLVGLEWQNSRQ